SIAETWSTRTYQRSPPRALHRWRISLPKATPAKFLGYVHAPQPSPGRLSRKPSPLPEGKDHRLGPCYPPPDRASSHRPRMGGSSLGQCGVVGSTAVEWFRAVSRQSINESSSNGLLRKPTAPAFIARFRNLSSVEAVMKMTGMHCPSATNWPCRSNPSRL